MDDFKWWVPRWFRNWYMLRPRKHASQECIYTCSPTAWVISQHKGRKTVWRGITPLFNEYTEGHVVIEGVQGWTYYGYDRPVEMDTDY